MMLEIIILISLFFLSYDQGVQPVIADEGENLTAINQSGDLHAVPPLDLSREKLVMVDQDDFFKAIPENERENRIMPLDINQDGKQDWVMILKQPEQLKYGVYLFLWQDNQTKPFKIIPLLERKYDNKKQDQGFVKTAMFLKEQGKPGLSDREYHSLRNHPQSQQKVSYYISVPAIEVWTGIQGQKDKALDEIAYCSKSFYFEDNTLQILEACD